MKHLNPIAVALVLVVTFCACLLAFVASSALVASGKADQAVQATAGNQAMIFAVCRALKRRDERNAAKWAAMTRIEDRYTQSDHSPYHVAQRAQLGRIGQNDHELLEFDDHSCVAALQAAYNSGYQSKKIRTGTLFTPQPFRFPRPIQTIKLTSVFVWDPVFP